MHLQLNKILESFDERFRLNSSEGYEEALVGEKIKGRWKDTASLEPIKSFLTQALTQAYQSAIDDAIKCVPEEKGKTGDFNMTFSDGVTSSIPIESNFDAGFNEARAQTLNNLDKLR